MTTGLEGGHQGCWFSLTFLFHVTVKLCLGRATSAVSYMVKGFPQPLGIKPNGLSSGLMLPRLPFPDNLDSARMRPQVHPDTRETACTFTDHHTLGINWALYLNPLPSPCPTQTAQPPSCAFRRGSSWAGATSSPPATLVFSTQSEASFVLWLQPLQADSGPTSPQFSSTLCPQRLPLRCATAGAAMAVRAPKTQADSDGTPAPLHCPRIPTARRSPGPPASAFETALPSLRFEVCYPRYSPCTVCFGLFLPTDRYNACQHSAFLQNYCSKGRSVRGSSMGSQYQA